MDFNIDFDFVRSQKLLLIPQLKQALDILEMNSRDLFNYMRNQLETNPALEEALGNVYPGTQLSEASSEMLSLKEHMLIQLDGLCTDRCSHLIGEYLIDNTDDNGYLTVDVREVAAFFNIQEQKVMEVLDKLQSLEPPGICARSLRECLLLQLKELDKADEEAVLVVENHLYELASDDAESVAQSIGLPIDRVKAIFSEIKGLEPRPGREFYERAADCLVVPDFFIRETKDGLQVLQNGEAFPDFFISESFTIKASEFVKNEGSDYVHDRVKSAVWLIKCLEQRENIIYSIAQDICIFEESFFKVGPKALKLLEKTYFADLLEMHESILEKALSGKYLQCRWGIFEFTSFFSEIEETGD